MQAARDDQLAAFYKAVKDEELEAEVKRASSPPPRPPSAELLPTFELDDELDELTAAAANELSAPAPKEGASATATSAASRRELADVSNRTLAGTAPPVEVKKPDSPSKRTKGKDGRRGAPLPIPSPPPMDQLPSFELDSPSDGNVAPPPPPPQSAARKNSLPTFDMDDLVSPALIPVSAAALAFINGCHAPGKIGASSTGGPAPSVAEAAPPVDRDQASGGWVLWSTSCRSSAWMHPPRRREAAASSKLLRAPLIPTAAYRLRAAAPPPALTPAATARARPATRAATRAPPRSAWASRRAHRAV